MIAQLVEFRPSKPVVAGSSPVHYLLCESSLTGTALDWKSKVDGSSPSFRAYALMVEFRIHDWLKTSYRNGLQVQVLLRVIYACVVQLEDTTDLGSAALWYEGSRPFAGKYASVVQMEDTFG